jgi:hypothetical protein
VADIINLSDYPREPYYEIDFSDEDGPNVMRIPASKIASWIDGEEYDGGPLLLQHIIHEWMYYMFNCECLGEYDGDDEE